jgi:hypothetical protein
MRALIILIFVPLLLSSQWTEKPKLNKKLKELETFMSNHIPNGHSSVSGYELTLNGTVLNKKTVLMGGDSHSKSFELYNSYITHRRVEMTKRDAEFFGYDEYWEVSIDGSWLHTELLKEKHALIMVEMLKDIQKSLK